jgi:hypothetical protein
MYIVNEGKVILDRKWIMIITMNWSKWFSMGLIINYAKQVEKSRF